MVESGAKFVVDTRSPKLREIELNHQRHYDAKYGFRRSEVMRAIKTFRMAGKPYAQIAHYLNEQGYTSPEGKAFYSMTIKRLEEDA